MIYTNEQTRKALGRLRQNPDFAMVVSWLEQAKQAGQDDILNVAQPHLIHQLQGSTLMLRDILRTIESAQPALPRA